MSSVSSPASSRTVGTADRLLHPLGRKADDDSSGATFAVKAAIAAQGPDPDAPSPADEVVVTLEAADDAAAGALLPDAAAATIEAAQTAEPALPDIDAANETTQATRAVDSGTPAAQAAHAYAQTMQSLLDAKISRALAARRAAKRDVQTDR